MTKEANDKNKLVNIHELTCQLQQNQQLWPFSEEDLEQLKDYCPNQLLRVSVKGTRKVRSLKQLRKYFVCCKKVADNTEDQKWNTKDKVDFSCRVALHFIDPKVTAVSPDGYVQFKYRSISFKNLKHIEACDYFNRAFEIMAIKIGKTVDELLENAE